MPSRATSTWRSAAACRRGEPVGGGRPARVDRTGALGGRGHGAILPHRRPPAQARRARYPLWHQRPVVGYGDPRTARRESVGAARTWLSGRASPCQGEGRGFESRRPLGRCLRAPDVEAGTPATAGWPSGLGKGLQIPVRGFDSRPGLGHLPAQQHSTGDWRSLVARFPDTEEVTGSSPVSPTTSPATQRPVPRVGMGLPGVGAPAADRRRARHPRRAPPAGVRPGRGGCAPGAATWPPTSGLPQPLRLHPAESRPVMPVATALPASRSRPPAARARATGWRGAAGAGRRCR